MKFGFTFDFMLMRLSLNCMNYVFFTGGGGGGGGWQLPIVTQYFASVLSPCTSGSACGL